MAGNPLLRVRTGNRSVGSNPILSATSRRNSGLLDGANRRFTSAGSGRTRREPARCSGNILAMGVFEAFAHRGPRSWCPAMKVLYALFALTAHDAEPQLYRGFETFEAKADFDRFAPETGWTSFCYPVSL